MPTAEQEFAPDFRARQIVPDADPTSMQAIYRLRFEVYCREYGYLPPADHTDQRESDGYDSMSAHFGAFNRNDELVGYVRLVAADAAGRFPLHHRGAVLFSGHTWPDPNEGREISRLMVRHDYRRRRGDTLAGTTDPDSHPDHVERRIHSPQILLSLFRQMYQFSLRCETRYWYATMDRCLMRSLVAQGFSFLRIGPPMDYFGPVAPYLADLRGLEARVQAARPALLTWLRQPGALPA